MVISTFHVQTSPRNKIKYVSYIPGGGGVHEGYGIWSIYGKTRFGRRPFCLCKLAGFSCEFGMSSKQKQLQFMFLNNMEPLKCGSLRWYRRPPLAQGLIYMCTWLITKSIEMKTFLKFVYAPKTVLLTHRRFYGRRLPISIGPTNLMNIHCPN